MWDLAARQRLNVLDAGADRLLAQHRERLGAENIFEDGLMGIVRARDDDRVHLAAFEERPMIGENLRPLRWRVRSPRAIPPQGPTGR